jgi:microcystin-dependent protein
MEYNMENFISQVIYMPFSWQMEGYLPCRGQIMDISHNQALFSLLGTNFGGDGQSTFALPDLRPWSDSGPDYGHRVRREWNPGELVAHICLNGVYPAHA